MAIMMAVILLSVFSAVLGWAEKNKAEARLGGLLVIAQSVDVTGSEKPGHHDVRFRVAFRNVGKQALCTGFVVRLESTLNVESRGSVHFDDKEHALGVQVDSYPIIHMPLPGNEIESDVVFTGEKNGIEPQTLVIKPLGSNNQSCNPEHRTPVVSYPARISVREIPSLESNPRKP